MRFAAWDRLDAWEELELLQIGWFLVDIQRDPADADALGPKDASMGDASPARGSKGAPLEVADARRIVGTLQQGERHSTSSHNIA